MPELNFKGNISVTYNNFDLVCSVENKIASECVVTVVEPELLKGLKIIVKDGVCTFKLGNISYDLDPSLVKQTEFVSSFAEIFEEVLRTTTCEKLENGNWLFTGQTSVGKFTLVQDAVTGYPKSLRIPGSNLFVEFSGMKSIDS